MDHARQVLRRRPSIGRCCSLVASLAPQLCTLFFAQQHLHAGRHSAPPPLPLKEVNTTLKHCTALRRRGHTPQYGSSNYEPAERRNRLLRILGGTGAAPAWPGLHTRDDIVLHQDANVIVSESDAGTTFELPLGPSRQGERRAGRLYDCLVSSLGCCSQQHAGRQPAHC